MEAKESNPKHKSFLEKTEFQWSDITPLPQYGGKTPIFNFQYPKDYEELMGYFRAIVQSGEISLRVFELTGFVVQYICGNYSAWLLRRKCIEKLDLDLLKELDFVAKTMSTNEKVYQIWEHRRWLIEKMNSPLSDLLFIDRVLKIDNKNYHAWSYRKWLVEKFELHGQELSALAQYFDQDIRNNSVWNQRFFICQKFIANKTIDVQSEIKFTMEKIKLTPDNESAWNYLNGWFKWYNFNSLKPKEPTTVHLTSKLAIQNISDFPEMEDFAQEVIKEDERCRFAYSTLVNIYLMKGEKEKIKEAVRIVEKLANDIDFTRKNYWLWFRDNILSDFPMEA